MAATANVAAAEATAAAAASWFTPYVSSLGLRCLAVLEDVWEADVVAAASAAGFDVIVTTTRRCVRIVWLKKVARFPAAVVHQLLWPGFNETPTRCCTSFRR